MSDLRKLISLSHKRGYISSAEFGRRGMHLQYLGGESDTVKFRSKKAVRTAREIVGASLRCTIYVTSKLDVIEYYED
jgi:hypothetical protein